MTLTLATVQVGDYQDRGAEYLRKLYDGLDRWLPKNIDYRRVCITDDAKTLPPGVQAKAPPPDISGWWNKLYLFSPELFSPGERVLYIDLDTIPIGDLTEIANYDGKFAAAQDFYWPEHINSSVMAWEAGAQDHVWEVWDQGGRPQFDRRGDQRWIEQLVPDAERLDKLFPGQIVSFKVDCWLTGPAPEGARLMAFHGQPRPHDCAAGFVKRLWNYPVGIQAQRESVISTPLESAQEKNHASI